MRHHALWLIGALSLGGASCSNDYDQFDLNGGKDGGGSSGAGGAGGATGGAAGTTGGAGGATGGAGGSTGGAGGAGGSTGGAGGSTGGSAGASGGAGGSSGSCGAGQKLCGSSCVPDDDPATGCAAASCDACTIANGAASCAGGACAVASCNGAFADCNGSAGDGCEANLGQPDNQSCGSCDNDCTTQGFSTHFSCGTDLICRCTSADQCKDGGGGSATCGASGRCVCSSIECNGGERCQKSGPNQVCSCNGSAACIPGQTCCPAPIGCKNLQLDAQNCGACGKACPSGSLCVLGACT